MSWSPLGFLRQTPEKKIAAARVKFDRGDYNEVRLDLEGVDHPDAIQLRNDALQALVEINLREWRAQANGGHSREATEALDRARQFGATKELIETYRTAKSSDVGGASHRLPPKPRPHA